MFKETASFKEGEFDRLLEFNGVYTNAATWLDWTYYQEKLPAEKLELVMRLEADRMANMVLTQSQLDSEREVVKNERRLRVDNDPEGRASEKLFHLHFKDHPYGHPTIGWMEDIDAITLEDCLQFYRTHYSPGNATVVVVGAVDVQEVLDLALKYYGDIPPVDVPPRRILLPTPPLEATTAFLKAPVQTQRVLTLNNAPALAAPHAMALGMACEILFNSESARIRNRLVEDEEIATDVGGWYSGFAMGGTFEVQANLAADGNWEAVMAGIDDEIRKAVTEGITPREREMSLNRLEMGFLRSLRSVTLRAQALGHYHATTGDFERYFRVLDEVRQVTERDITAAIRESLVPSARTVVAQLPE